LHPTQRRLAQQNFRGPARVLGGAGTGKTVVLMHRAAHLARKVFSAPTDRVLVTTYTRNLANDLLENLTRLCPDVVDRLEVTNLHRWASDFLASQGMRLKPAPESVTESLWNELLANTTDFTAGFYRQEWERVVQAHDCLTRDGYLAASRVGRGTRLSRPQRLQLWTLFESYRNALRERGLAEYADMVREARMLIEKSPGILPYRAVLADEVQDFRPADLKLLRALVPRGENDIFVVGDGHQRIYGHKASLGKAGIDIRGRSRNLRINYRTTQKIRNFAVRLLEGQTIDDLDGGVDDLRGYRSLREGVPPQVHLFKTPAQETACILERLAGWLADGVKPEEICLAARVNSQVEEYARQLQAAGHVVQKIEASGDKKLKPGFRIATMHRLKGLEFRALVLAGVQEGSVPFPLPHPDEASREDHLLGERCLLYVAATRARDLLCVTGHGGRSELLG
jgi:superfamily I DNA/RNA helicase